MKRNKYYFLFWHTGTAKWRGGKEEKAGGENGERGQSPEVTWQLSHWIWQTANTHTHTVHEKYLSHRRGEIKSTVNAQIKGGQTRRRDGGARRGKWGKTRYYKEGQTRKTHEKKENPWINNQQTLLQLQLLMKHGDLWIPKETHRHGAAPRANTQTFIISIKTPPVYLVEVAAHHRTDRGANWL